MIPSDDLCDPGKSVEADWAGALPEALLQIFLSHCKGLERSYAMFSVALDNAIRLRDEGSWTTSIEEVVLASSLCHRLSDRLRNMLALLAEHCKEYGTSPSVAPLDPTAFLSWSGARGARSSLLLNLVPCSQRLRFLHKIGALEKIVESVAGDFCAASEELVSATVGTSEPAPLWEVMDASHFDLNTCLRELIVMLKCFLRALPIEQFEVFGNKISERKALACAASAGAR